MDEKTSGIKKLKEKIIQLDEKKVTKAEKTDTEKDIKIPDINSFKSNSFAMTTNKLQQQ